MALKIKVLKLKTLFQNYDLKQIFTPQMLKIFQEIKKELHKQ